MYRIVDAPEMGPSAFFILNSRGEAFSLDGRELFSDQEVFCDSFYAEFKKEMHPPYLKQMARDVMGSDRFQNPPQTIEQAISFLQEEWPQIKWEEIHLGVIGSIQGTAIRFRGKRDFPSSWGLPSIYTGFWSVTLNGKGHDVKGSLKEMVDHARQKLVQRAQDQYAEAVATLRACGESI